LIPEGDWLVVAVSVPAFEPLSSFHERLAEMARPLDESDGRLLPGPWDARRREAQAHGVPIKPPVWEALTAWARRFEVPLPCVIQVSG
jgi:LDH2 family malate/lactate/ureidoglycolate dehydrogenase